MPRTMSPLAALLARTRMQSSRCSSVQHLFKRASRAISSAFDLRPDPARFPPFFFLPSATGLIRIDYPKTRAGDLCPDQIPAPLTRPTSASLHPHRPSDRLFTDRDHYTDNSRHACNQRQFLGAAELLFEIYNPPLLLSFKLYQNCDLFSLGRDNGL
jgi:hypothetical protein